MWLYIPRKYCPCSPELLDSISEFGLFFQSLELSVSLSGKATQRPYSWRGWKTRPWMKLLSGVTLQPSTAAAGMELWIQSVSASLASRSVALASEPESRKGHDQDSSLKPAELFAKYDQGIFLSKTCQDSFLTSSCPSYLENFPKWGSMRSGECFQQEMWVAPILEKESSSSRWITPRLVNARGSKKRREQGSNESVKSQAESLSWRTPRATEYKNPDQSHAQKAKGLPVEHLSAQTKNWPTPRVCMRSKRGVKDLNSDKYKNAEAPKIKLRDQSASWPTPSATEVRQGVQDRSRGKKGSQESLTTIVLKEFECNNPTGPMAPVNESNGSDSSKSAQTSPQPLKKRLNPKFVEHLMGMPLGWSLPIPIDQNDYKRWETESCHLLRLLHSASYGNE